VERTFALVSSLLAIGFLGVLAIPALTGHVSVAWDHGALYLPLRAFYAQCLAKGEPFEWMPQLHAGFELTGAGEVGPYHPFHWLLYRWLPLDLGFSLEVVAPYFFSLAGAYLFFASYVGFAAAAGAALLFTFSLVSLQWIAFPHMAGTLAHIPWSLWVTGRVAASRRVASTMLGMGLIALLTGSQVLMLHPQALWFSFFTEALFLLFLRFDRRLDWRSLGSVLLGIALGLLIGSVQLSATYGSYLASTRADVTAEFAAQYSLPPHFLWGTLVPAIYWGRQWSLFSGGVHFGTVPLVLAVGLWALPRVPAASGRRATFAVGTEHRLALFGAMFAVLSLWLSLGEFGPLYRFQALLPVVGKLRASDRYIALVQLGISIVAAVALARLIVCVRDVRKVPWLRLCVPWLLLVASLCTASYFAAVSRASSSSDFRASFATGPAVMLLALLGLSLAARGHALGLYLLLLVASFETTAYGLLNDNSAKQYWYDTPRYADWVASMPTAPDERTGRLFARTMGDQQLLRGQRFANGYSGLEPRRSLDYRELNALRVAEVAWVFHQGFGPMHKTRGLKARSKGWYSIPGPLPRVRLVGDIFVSRTPAEDIARIDVERMALVTHPLRLSHAGPAAGRITLVQDRPGRLAAKVETEGTSLLVFSERFDRNWRASIDGVRTRVERVNGDFMGCVVGAGTHAVSFQYHPAGLQRARVASGIGAALAFGLIACAAVFKLRERRRDASEGPAVEP
jgi:hypothetical protein